MQSNIKSEGERCIPFDASMLTNAIKIMHSRESSQVTEQPNFESSTSTVKISCSDSIRFEKENEQPNRRPTENPGHAKSDTVI